MAEAEVRYMEPENYVNRELSWLEFNYRVLGEARDKTTPLFDRLKFLSITASNLDEFFMVRVASLKDMVHAGYNKPDIAGMTAQQQLDVNLITSFCSLAFVCLVSSLLYGSHTLSAFFCTGCSDP